MMAGAWEVSGEHGQRSFGIEAVAVLFEDGDSSLDVAYQAVIEEDDEVLIFDWAEEAHEF